MPEPDWTLVVHGGAKAIPADRHEVHRRGMLAAVQVGSAVLRSGGSAVDAAEVAVRCLEDDPVYNAGHGGARNADGDVELDAAIMDGATLDVGAVAAVRTIANPIQVARLLLRQAPILLVGSGAEAFAAHQGVPRIDNAALKIGTTTGRADTVGAVARDSAGHLAAASAARRVPSSSMRPDA